KHAVRTVITSLTDLDRLAVVTFSDEAKIELPLTAMTDAGKQAAMTVIGRLETIASTNIWGGIDKALSIFRSSEMLDSRLAAAFLFTDGLPNIRPPMLEVAMLEKRRKQFPDQYLPCILNTFGFGNNVDAVLLTDLARIGEGSFNFIPDASFVGTVFVDATANILSAIAKRIRITIEPINGAELCLSSNMTVGGHMRKDTGLATLAGLPVSTKDSKLSGLDGFNVTKAGLYVDKTDTSNRDMTIANAAPSFINESLFNMSLASSAPSFINESLFNMSLASSGSLRIPEDVAPVPKGPVTFGYGLIIAGQSKDLVVYFDKVPDNGTAFVNVMLEYVNVRSRGGSSSSGGNGDGAGGRNTNGYNEFTMSSSSSSARNRMVGEVKLQFYRSIAVDRINIARLYSAVGDFKASAKTVQELLDDLKTAIATLSNDQRLRGLYDDIEGQVTQAIKEQYFDRWGKPYLLSLMGAHRYQVCNNFKDPGVQFYSGELFDKLRDDISEIFLTIPAPTPSRNRWANRGGGRGSARVGQGMGGIPAGVPVVAPHVPQINMRAYHNSSNPCFDGGAKVLVKGVGLRKVTELCRGDLVDVGGGCWGKVSCVVETSVPKGCVGATVVRLPGSGLVLTPWHPVLIDGVWRFPCTVEGVCMAEPVRRVYSLVVEDVEGNGRRCSAVVVDGVVCVTLGHGLTGDVVGHGYLGTERVIDDLKGMRGFVETGRVVVSGVRRDLTTGLICGFVEGGDREVHARSGGVTGEVVVETRGS
ncbi:hypothetical protein HDU76_006122, partial [Blyttiomyces sp. JEL0837]